jgi:Flp pilus assembly protein TadG
MGWLSRVAGGLPRLLARYAGAEGANVAIIFALSLVPLLVAAGTAVDLSRALVVRSRLASALDAAGLAVGATVNLTELQMQDLAEKYFDANYPAEKLGVPGSVSVHLVGKIITMSATAQLDTSLMYLVGINHLNVGASNEITRETKGLELAMVLDNTGSMSSSGKLTALKTAATDMIDSLSGGENFPDQLKIGIVPFTVAVKLDTIVAVNGGWIDTAGASSVAQVNFSGGKYAYWMYTNAGGLSNTAWAGCVEARPNRLDETDTAPTAGNPDTRFVPWFQPSEPNIAEPENPHATDVVNSNQSGMTSNFANTYIVTPNLSVWNATLTQNSSNISTGSDTFSVSSHGLSTAMGPVMVSSSSTLPAPLSAATNYWVIKTNSNTLKLATSASNASAGTAVNITSVGTNGATLTLTGVSQVSDTLLLKAHGMATADGPINAYISSNAGTVPTGLTATTDYWVIKIDANSIKLASNRANALAGTAVNFTANGSGTLSTSESPAGTDLAHQTSRQKQWLKYVGRTYTSTTGPNTGCNMQQVTPMTNDMQSLETKINSMVAQGSTNVPIGLTWGWKLISPAAPFTDGVAYSDNGTIKAIVLMTDGENDMPGQNSNLNKGGYSANGYPAQGRMGNFNAGGFIDDEREVNSSSYEMEAGLAESERRICDAIKAIKDSSGNDRIRIYTIALMVPDGTDKDNLEYCASTDEMFFDTPSAAELQAVFQTIAQDLSNLRVSK